MVDSSDDGQEATRSQRAAGRGRRERLDMLVLARALAPSRERARALIMAGEVRVDGRILDKAGALVPADAHVELVGPAAEMRYVSRGGLKLERALDVFRLDPAGRVCLDAGASTGGFTDVLLRRGAARVYAVDVGRGQIAWSLRSDPRVVLMERTNLRHLAALPEAVECATLDVSFISLRLVLPPVAALLASGGWVVALVKPQFEAGRAAADRGAGVIADPAVHRRVLRELLAWVAEWPERPGLWLAAQGLIPSPVTGRDGNHEYLLHLAAPLSGSGEPAAPVRERGPVDSALVDSVVAAAFDSSSGVDPRGGRR
jgi:23S rRNA (cytidine1920-2'-O)/16S rRNA (cytidine1409-2'-O)-methyltransferase